MPELHITATWTTEDMETYEREVIELGSGEAVRRAILRAFQAGRKYEKVRQENQSINLG